MGSRESSNALTSVPGRTPCASAASSNCRYSSGVRFHAICLRLAVSSTGFRISCARPVLGALDSRPTRLYQRTSRDELQSVIPSCKVCARLTVFTKNTENAERMVHTLITNREDASASLSFAPCSRYDRDHLWERLPRVPVTEGTHERMRPLDRSLLMLLTLGALLTIALLICSHA